MSSTTCLELLNFHRATWPQELFHARFLVFGGHCFFTLTRETLIFLLLIFLNCFIAFRLLARFTFFLHRPSVNKISSCHGLFIHCVFFLLFDFCYSSSLIELTLHTVLLFYALFDIFIVQMDELMLNNNFYFENFGFHKDNNFFFSLHRRPNYREMPCVMSSSYAKKNLVWTHNSQYGGRFGFVRSLRFCF